MGSMDKDAQALQKQLIPTVLNNMKMELAKFKVFGLHLIDHPVSGLATDIDQLHAKIEKALAQLAPPATTAAPVPGAGNVPVNGDAPVPPVTA